MALTIAQAQAKISASDYEGWGVAKSVFVPRKSIPLALQVVAEYIEAFERAADDRLNAMDRIDTGSLASSIRFETTETVNGIIIEVFVNDYYKFVDKGVRGVGPGNKNNTSPYKFRYANPSKSHIEAMRGWIRRNGLKSRAKDVQKYGRIGREKRQPEDMRLAQIIARSIKMKGLKRTGFWEDSINETFKDFDIKMAEALGIDIAVNLKNMVKEIKTKK
jgi:hypothetical protein